MAEAVCPICGSKATVQSSRRDGNVYDCERCGDYFLTRTVQQLVSLKREDGVSLHLVSRYLRKSQSSKDLIELNSETLDAILKAKNLSPADQANELILFLGSNLQKPEDTTDILPLALASEIGAIDGSGVGYIKDYLVKTDLVREDGNYGDILNGTTNMGRLGLTFKGWQKYEELKVRNIDSRRAFMAMAFSNTDLTRILNDHLIPEVRKAGFELARLDHEPKAGLMDNLLREAISQAKFLVADLTDQNPGAYWEAGFAEGLGRPVFYMCEKSVWDSKKTHFDTEHYQTIIWDVANPDEAAKRLKASIRVTLRAEARMNDE